MNRGRERWRHDGARAKLLRYRWWRDHHSEFRWRFERLAEGWEALAGQRRNSQCGIVEAVGAERGGIEATWKVGLVQKREAAAGMADGRVQFSTHCN